MKKALLAYLMIIPMLISACGTDAESEADSSSSVDTSISSISSNSSDSSSSESEPVTHNYDENWSYDTNSHWHRCLDEGFESLKKDNVPHSYEDTIVEPTYESGGYTTRTCSVCGYYYRYNYTERKEHNYASTFSYDQYGHWNPCIDPGYESLKTNYSVHSMYEEVTPATYDAGGYTTHKCHTCDYSYKDNETEQLKYSVTWKDYNNEVLKTDYYVKGNIPSYGATNPSRADEGGTEYHFAGWEPAVSIVTSDQEYIATYSSNPIEYTVSFDMDGGTSPSCPTEAIKTTSLSESLFYDCTKEGYDFRGWSYNGVRVFDENGEQINVFEPERTITFKAIFKNSITVSMSVNEGYEGVGYVFGGGEYAYGSEVSINAGASEGYKFVCWYINGYYYNNNYHTYFIASDEDVEVKAIFAESSYVNKNCYAYGYHDQGGIGGAAYHRAVGSDYYSNVAWVVTVGGAPISLRARSDIEAPFLGWYDKDGNLLSEDLYYDFIMPESDISLYAKWDRYNIAYDLDGGTNDSRNPGAYSSKDQITLYPASKTGKSFIGWEYEGNIITSIDVSLKKNITLKAIYGGSGDLSNFDYEIDGTSITITGYANKGTKEINVPRTAVIDDEEYTITSIQKGAFSDCTTVESISLPFLTNGFLGYIFGQENYSDDNLVPSSLKTVTILDGCTLINNYAFSNCSSIETIVLPSTTEGIGYDAFEGCTSLKNLTIPFIGLTKDIYVSLDELGITRTSLEEVVLLDGCPNIHNNAFDGCVNLKSITIPNTVSYIGSYAFRNCSSLTSISIPSNVTGIDNGAFMGSSSLETVSILATDAYIGNSAFSGCNQISSLTLPLTRDTSRLYSIFGGSVPYSLSSVTIVDGSTSIVDYAMANCSHLETVVIPDSVTTIGQSALANNNWLTSLTVPFIGKSKTENRYLAYLFGGSSYTYGSIVPSNLKTITISEACDSIADYAFYSCYYIETVNLPNSVTSIPNNAFEECWNLDISSILAQNITSIGAYAFKGCDNALEVIIPNTVTTIGEYAFCECEGLKTVIIEDGSNEVNIEASAFSRCYALTSINIPNSVTSLGTYAFANCTALTSITIPSSIKSIPSYAFSNNIKLESVLLPDGLDSIGSYAFASCKIASIYIPSSVTNIDGKAFSNCSQLDTIVIDEGNEYYSALDGVLYNKDFTTLLYYSSGKKDTSYVAPDTLKVINKDIFKGNTTIVSVTLPEGLLSIGMEAFSGCTSLATINIPSTVTEITSYAFKNCSALTSISIPANVNTINNDTFFGCTALETVNLSDGLVTIYDRAFSGCTSLATISIPNTVTHIYSGAFYSCTSLTELTLPTSLQVAGIGMLANCTSLTTLTIPYVYSTSPLFTNIGGYFGSASYTQNGTVVPASLKTVIISEGSTAQVYDHAFDGCTSITTIVIPSSVTNIGYAVFQGCSSLTTLTLPYVGNDLNQYDYFSYMFGCYEYNSQYVPASLKTVNINGGFTTIPNYAFYECNHITTINLPDSIEAIGTYAFYGCSSLNTINIPEGITTIPAHCFEGCSSLTSINLPASVEHIGEYAYQDCTGFEILSIPEEIQTIGENAFKGCASISSLTLPFIGTSRESTDSLSSVFGFGCENLVEIIVLPGHSVINAGQYTFNGCSNVKTIVIPVDAELGHNIFYYCSSLETLTAPSTIQLTNLPSTLKEIIIAPGSTAICNYCFQNLSGNVKLTIPNSVTSIGAYAFYGYKGTSITIPSSVASIEGSSFYSCQNLVDIIIDGESDYFVFEDGILYNKDKTTIIHVTNRESFDSFTVPNHVTTIGNYAFNYCTNLTSIVIPDTVTSIGNGAFIGCTSLTSMTLPFIGETRTSSNNHLYNIFGEISNYYLPSSLKNIIVSDGCESIGAAAFYNSKYIETIYIPTSVTSIGSSAFSYCDSLIELSVPFTGCSKTENKQMYQVCGYCKSLERLILLDGCESVGRIEMNETPLKSVSLPSTVTSIDLYAFQYCTCSVIWRDTPTITKLDHSAFNGYLGSSLVLPKSVKTIYQYAFTYCTADISFEEGTSLTNVSSFAFYEYLGKTISLPETSDFIDIDTGNTGNFCRCSNLESFIVSVDNDYYCAIDGVLYDKTRTTLICYPGAKKVDTIVIPKGVTQFARSAFACTTAPIVWEDGSLMTSINTAAFEYTESPSITIPNCIETVDAKTFIRCGSTIIWEDDPSIYTIHVYSYTGTSFVIPSSIELIGYEAITNNVSLTSLTLPTSITEIKDRAFSGCSSLESITYLGTIEQWYSITKGDGWRGDSVITSIVCSNGTVLL